MHIHTLVNKDPPLNGRQPLSCSSPPHPPSRLKVIVQYTCMENFPAATRSHVHSVSTSPAHFILYFFEFFVFLMHSAALASSA